MTEITEKTENEADSDADFQEKKELSELGPEPEEDDHPVHHVELEELIDPQP